MIVFLFSDLELAEGCFKKEGFDKLSPRAKEHTPGQIIPAPELAEGCILNVGLRQAQPPAKEHTPGHVFPAPELAEGLIVNFCSLS